MSKVRCFLNGDPNNFYYVTNEVIETVCDEDDNYLGDPLTESGLIEDGCVFVPFTRSHLSDHEPYDSIIDGSLTKENIASRYRGNTTAQYSLNRHWDRYKAIIDNGAYTKENGFDIQKLKELGFTLPITKFTGEVKHNQGKHSAIRCFLNGDPNNFYYVSGKVIEFAYDENGKDLGEPLTESGLAEDGCVYIPTPIDYNKPSAYELIADGSLTKENIESVYNIDSAPYLLNRDWDKYKSIVDSGAYTKENGFDIQKLKKMGYGYYTSSKPIDESNPNDNKCDEDAKSENNDGLDLHTIIEESIKSFYKKNAESGDNGDLIINSWMNILTVYLKALAWEIDDEIGEEDLFFEDRFSNLNQILNIRTLSFFVKDKEEKMSVLDRIEQALLADTEEGKEYRKHLDSRQLWMMEYQDQKNFVLETPVISSDDKKGLGNETSKLRFIFSPDTVKVKEFFVFSDTEDTGLSMDALVDFG